MESVFFFYLSSLQAHTAKGEATIWRDGGGRLWQAPSRADRYRELMGLRCWPLPPHQAAPPPSTTLSPRPTPRLPARPPHTSVSLSPPPAVFSFSYFSRPRVPVTRLQFVSKQRSEETNLPLCDFFSLALIYLFILHSTAKEPHLAQQLYAHIVPSNSTVRQNSYRELLFFH